MNKAWIAMVLALVSAASIGAQSLEHRVLENETVWHISEIYFGSGHHYVDILKANHLQKPTDVKVGMVLRIENPKYSKPKASLPFSGTRDPHKSIQQKALEELRVSNSGAGE